MLEIVAKGFKNAKNALTGKATLTEENIEQALREIRVSLLEADVELGVVKTFLDRVKERAIGEVVTLETGDTKKKLKSTPGDHFVFICHAELEKLMGPVQEAPIKFRRPYTTIMMVGLQGTGKTTTVGKLASWLVADKRKPLLVAADVYRPAAVDQLKILGEQVGAQVYAEPNLAPPQLCQDALREARKKKRDVVIFDTAGRLAIDDEMMRELEEIKQRTRPDEIFLVVDAMAGQDAVKTAAEFNRRLDLTGFIMTKLDGDARGGAALSIKEISGKPIKFLGMGETLDKLEVFRPEGLASRILGMGDIVGLMKDFESVVDEKQAERDARKLLKGQFTLDDFLAQLKMLGKLGSVKEIYEKFPIFGDAPPGGPQVDEGTFKSMESIIQSMTKDERVKPALIDDSRARRIARGSGRKPEQVKDLIARFNMMHQVMASFATQPGLLQNLPGFKQLSQIRQLKGLGMQDVIGKPTDAIRAMARGQVRPGMPGLPGMSGLPSMGGGLPGMGGAGLPGMGGGAAMPAGMMPAGYPAVAARPGPRQLSQKERQKLKQKRKAERQARKKARRK